MIDAINNSMFDVNFLRDIEANTSRTNNTGNTRENKINAEDQQNQVQEEKTNRPGSKNPGELSEEEKREVQKLKETDRKVRQHEMAHLAAAQGIAMSGANFQYQRGPDGVNYAVGGDVKIDVSKEQDPEATIDKAQRIATAALAPSDPSPQDRQVAAKARQMEAQARMEMAKAQQQETTTKQDTRETPGNINSSQPNEPNLTDTQNRPHPGIQTYKQNQAFAPFTANTPGSDNNTTSAAPNNIIPINDFRLDMVA